MTIVLNKDAAEGSHRFLVRPGDWFRGRKVKSVDIDWTAGTVTLEVSA